MTFPSSLRSPPLPLQRAVRFNNCRRRHAAAVPRRLRFGLSVVRAATTPRRREGEAGGGGGVRRAEALLRRDLAEGCGGGVGSTLLAQAPHRPIRSWSASRRSQWAGGAGGEWRLAAVERVLGGGRCRPAGLEALRWVRGLRLGSRRVAQHSLEPE